MQLFTMFVPFALMSCKTQALYFRVFESVTELMPDFGTTNATDDFNEASAAE